MAANAICQNKTTNFICCLNGLAAVYCQSYLLGLLAMIKCSICSYQCDNWYASNWRLACHVHFWAGSDASGTPLARIAERRHCISLAVAHPFAGTKFGDLSPKFARLRWAEVFDIFLAVVKKSHAI